MASRVCIWRRASPTGIFVLSAATATMVVIWWTGSNDVRHSLENRRQHCHYTVSDLFPGDRSEFGDEFNPTEGNKNARWQPIGVDESFVYSGYIDDRNIPDVDAIQLPVARIFSIFPRQLTVVGRWRCLYWFDEKFLEPAEVKVAKWTNLNTFDPPSVRTAYAMLLCPVPYYSTKYRQYSFLCHDTNVPYPQIDDRNVTSCLKSGLAPVAVSIVPRKCSKPVNLVWLVDLPARRRLINSSKALKRTQFAVCVPPVYGHDLDLRRDLIEFIQVNRIFGARRFFFFVETDQAEFLSCIQKLRSKADNAIIEWVPWNLTNELSSLLKHHGQFITINECIYRLLYLVDFIVGKDLDEFVVPTVADTWSQMLDALPCQSQSVASYSIRNRFLRMNWPESPNSNSSVIAAGYPALVQHRFRTLRFWTGEAGLYPWKERSKIIARPDRIFLWHVHEILDSSIVNGTAYRNCYIDAGDAVLYHYRSGVAPLDVASTVNATRILQHFLSPVMRSLNEGVKMCYGG